MHMQEKEFKPVPTRVENIIKGLFVALLSIIIAINVGKVSRTLAFVPLYLFGAAMYPLLAFGFFSGLYRVFRQKKIRFKYKIWYFGLILILLSFVFVVAYASVKSTGNSFANLSVSDSFNSYNAQLGNYYSVKFINPFDTSSLWPVGIIGLLLGGLIANDAIVLFIGIVLFLLGVFSFFVHLLFSKKDKRTRKEKKEGREAAKKAYLESQAQEIDNNPVISREPAFAMRKEEPTPKEELKPVEVTAGYESNRSVENENAGFNQINPSLDQAFSSQVEQPRTTEYTEFTPLVFNNSSSPFGRFINQQPQVVAAAPQPAPVNKPVVEEAAKPIDDIKVEGPEFKEDEPEENLIDSRPVINSTPAVVVEEKKVDEELVTMQPKFVDVPEMQSSPSVGSYQMPVEEPVKKRERVVWIPPSSDLLMTYETETARELNESVANERVTALNNILSDFRIGASISGYTIGPSVTRFNIEYEPNVSSKVVEKYIQDISRRLGGVSSRFAPVVQGESFSGLEVPNATITTVSFKDVFLALPDVKKHPTAVAFGKDISGRVIFADYCEFPHLLVAGTTGSGKSIFVHSIISTLIMRMSPDDLKIVLVDPKKVEMTKYRDMPHLLCPIITEAEKAKVCLQKVCEEMERRYALIAQDPEISDIKGYNAKAKEKGEETLPYILAVLDEYADLVDSCKEISQPVVSIAQKARSAGIHLLIATQRPSTNVITGVIKGNLPTRVALATSSYTDSMTIIGEGGAESLLGKGDMLVQSPLISRNGVTRLQGCYVQNKEIVHIVNYLKEHYETHYDENYLDLVDHSKEPAVNVLAPGEVEKESSQEEENKYQSIKEWVMSQQFVSMSKIQRECSVGFNRAGRFFSRLQKEGIVDTKSDGSSKGCRVLVHDDFYSGDDYGEGGY